MPAVSKAQFRFMKGKAHGMDPGGPGPSPAQAKEYVAGQHNFGSLPNKVGKKKKKRAVPKKPGNFGQGIPDGDMDDSEMDRSASGLTA